MKENTNQSFHFTKPQPAPEPVELGPLLDEISAAIRTHVVLSEHAAALALWVVHTYVFDTRDAVAYVSIESPEKRCGKTTLLSVLAGLACRALVASNITVSALFRVIDDAGPTLLIDEADTFLGGNSVMRGILNCGNTWRTAYVLRLSSRKARSPKPKAAQAQEAGFIAPKPGEGGTLDSSLVRYSCWCPKVIAMIGRVPDTIADRSIVVRLERKLVTEKCAPLTDFKPEPITSKCVRFADDNSELIAKAALEAVPGLNDRAADTFEPLFVLARMAGPEWFQRATEAALILTSSQNTDQQGAGLLLDILTIFVEYGAEKMFSRSVVYCLRGEGQWIASQFFAGKPLNELLLSQALRPYGIRPVTIRVGEEINKGYRIDDFKNSLRRYVPRMDIDARLAEMKANAVLRREAKAEEAGRLKKEAEAEKASEQERQQDKEASDEEFARLLAGMAKREIRQHVADV
ncbi:MAG: DUF3631 domain-containing protein [Limisphaerales bacterium]